MDRAGGVTPSLAPSPSHHQNNNLYHDMLESEPAVDSHLSSAGSGSLHRNVGRTQAHHSRSAPYYTDDRLHGRELDFDLQSESSSDFDSNDLQNLRSTLQDYPVDAQNSGSNLHLSSAEILNPVEILLKHQHNQSLGSSYSEEGSVSTSVYEDSGSSMHSNYN